MKPEDVLGRRCKDRINNFSGICIGFQDWMFGCRHYLIKGDTFNGDTEKNIVRVPEPIIEVLSPEIMENLVTNFNYIQEEEAFGKFYRDIVTGYSGVCVGIAYICYDEIQYYIESQNKKKKIPLDIWPLDKGRLRIIDDKEIIDPKDTRSDSHKGGVDCIPIIA